MYRNDQLAIIIPAYKADYLQSALQSVSEQTDQNFHLYIGDDAGDTDIPAVVDSFSSILKITYKRFEENLGRKSLVSHWNRCFEMTGGEKWFWLFSDDDLMSPHCVENFRKALTENKSSKIFKHDSAKFINDLEVIKENSFEDDINTSQFLKLKFTYAAESYVVEYIFDSDLLKTTGGFRDFPFGWCADDLFWILSSQYSPIVKIRETKVFWRFSELNISGRLNSRLSSKKKLQACYLFLKELKSSGLFKHDPQLSKMAVAWYAEQFNYLKTSLSYFDQLLFLSAMFLIFPLELLEQATLKVKTGK